MAKKKAKSKPARPRPPRTVREYVTELKSLERQIGEHVLKALKGRDTVAVLTAGVGGQDGAQALVSIGLNSDQLDQVRQLLAETPPEFVERVPCIGFQCYLHPALEELAAEESAPPRPGDAYDTRRRS